MKVWVLAQGEYDDYEVVGVFSSREKAIEYVQKNKDVLSIGSLRYREPFEVNVDDDNPPEYTKLVWNWRKELKSQKR